MFKEPKRNWGRIAFDFDGTLAENVWPKPECGGPIQEGIDALLWYYEHNWEVFIFTSRPASHKPMIASWLVNHGLDKAVYDIVTDKPHFDVLIDDRVEHFPEGIRVPQDELFTESNFRSRDWMREMVMAEVIPSWWTGHPEGWKFPHCDALTLHLPTDCQHCDRVPDLQRHRFVKTIPFSGEPGAPDALFRPDEVIKRWGGNVAKS